MTLTWLGQEARTEGCSTGKRQVFGPLCCGVGGDIGDSDDDQRGLDLTWGRECTLGKFLRVDHSTAAAPPSRQSSLLEVNCELIFPHHTAGGESGHWLLDHH